MKKAPLPEDYLDECAGIAERFPALQYVFVQMLTEHLVDCRRSFGGDLDCVLILAIIGQNHIKAYLASNSDPSRTDLSMGMTASRIADVAEMSRQTVRRKLAALEKRGWLVRDADAVWSLSGRMDDTAPGKDLAELSRRGIERALRLTADVTRIMTVPPE